MKVLFSFILMAVLVFSFILAPDQNVFAQDTDTLDVIPGLETLNLAVQGDTTVTGEPKNLNRVYRLARGGHYLLNGTIKGVKGAHLRIVADKGTGPRPIIIPAVTETGSASRAFQPSGDGTWKGLYVSGIDNLGNQAGTNMFRLGKQGGRYIIDDCFIDHDAQSFVRITAEDIKIYVKNTTMRNPINLSAWGNSRFIDTRGNTTDTIFVQNCTWYVCSNNPISNRQGIIKNVILDHVTMYQVAPYEGKGWNFAALRIERAVNCQVTNCLFVDYGYDGYNLSMCADGRVNIVPIDSLKAPDLAAEEARNYLIKNNVYGWTPEVTNFINSMDTLDFYPLHDQISLDFIAAYPNMISENNIEEYPVFSDPPDPANIVAFSEYRYQNDFTHENVPDPRADRNGQAPLTEDPGSMGPAEDEYDFDYSTESKAYTHAAGGFPVGDLNWFPSKKAEWKTWVETSVDFKKPVVPNRFTLEQNYPNPFNPMTKITYELGANTSVKLAVYNTLGQKVRTLVSEKRQAAGEYSLQWDGLDDTDRQLTTGVYFYRLEAGDQVQTKKMLLIR